MLRIKNNILNIKNPNTGIYECIPAIAGESAYEIAVRNGYIGSEAEWLKDVSGTGSYCEKAGTAKFAEQLKLTKDVGSITKPVFFSANGIPNEVKYTLGNACEYDVTDDPESSGNKLITTRALNEAISNIKDSYTSLVSNEVARIISNAPEDLDTLKEISDWINGHELSAANMNSAIVNINNNKVDKVTGKGLSTNDLTDKLKSDYDATVYAVNVLNGTGDGSVIKTVTDEIAKISSGGSSEGLDAVYAKKSLYDDTSINVGRLSDTDIGDNSTALGIYTTASGNYSYAEGCRTKATSSYAHAEGSYTTASGNASHSEGDTTIASGSYSHAEGYHTKATDSYAHAEGAWTEANGYSAHAEGYECIAIVDYSHAEGYSTEAFGRYSHAEGSDTVSKGQASHAECYNTKASGDYSHSEGYFTEASGRNSHAEGLQTIALINQHAQGHYNDSTVATENSIEGTSDGTAFVIGNGSYSSRSNAFRITGEGVIYSTNASVNVGADYAEYFEWSDGNPDKEDRVGHFVTFDEENPEKIRYATEGDFILGIVSGMPNVIGNGDECWKQRYLLDDFGRYIEETFEYEEISLDPETREEIKVTKTGTKWKENPDYDSSKPYIPRRQRPEWSAIGMLGVLSVYDDGSCKVNGYCRCTQNGIATASETGSGYRVIKRVSDNIVKVVII